ncbi:MAG: short-chain dehydrogenase [Gammaproteobacteria bacterium]|nr:MAG: short-chain dehydrogenase [Gammaproteobacteria bacterium]
MPALDATDKYEIRREQAALITGGATRLGRHFALTLARRGYDIALHYNSSARAAEKVRQEITATGRHCEIFHGDFSCETSPAQLIESAHRQFPTLQLLINSASVYEAGNISETGPELLREQFSVNFFAPFLLTAAFAKYVQSGNIINIIDNKIGFQQYAYSAYLLSKKALSELTRLSAIELAPYIRVNGIAPGVILPDESRTDEYINWREEGIPLQQHGSVEQLSSALNYLLDNNFVTGQVLFVDGGEAISHIGRNACNYADN